MARKLAPGAVSERVFCPSPAAIRLTPAELSQTVRSSRVVSQPIVPSATVVFAAPTVRYPVAPVMQIRMALLVAQHPVREVRVAVMVGWLGKIPVAEVK